MHANKTNSQQGRRTPLSLAGGGPKQHGKHSSRHEHKNASHKRQQEQNSLNLKDALPAETKKSQQVSADKKDQQQQQQLQLQQQQLKQQQQQQQNEEEDVIIVEDAMKAQNGVGKTNGNAKDKEKQNGSGSGENGHGMATRERRDKEKTEVQAQEPPKDEAPPAPVEEKPTEEWPPNPVEPQTEMVAPPVEEKSTPKTRRSQTMTPTKANTTPSKMIPGTPKRAPEKTTPKSLKAADEVPIVVLEEKAAEEPRPPPPEAIEMDLADESPVKGGGGRIAELGAPPATSTPGRLVSRISALWHPSKSEVASAPVTPSAAALGYSPRNFSQISGRRSIRPLSQYTPSKFENNPRFRESYRRINTELDVSSVSNSSLHVTVGSEVPDNASFSFFGFGRRKRERTPPTAEPMVEASPPKRARLDGFFSAVASPLTMLRSRFSKTTIQGGPLAAEEAEDEGGVEVQNVSGISIEEDVDTVDQVDQAGEDTTIGKEVTEEGEEKKACAVDEDGSKKEAASQDLELDEKKKGAAEASFVPAVGEPEEPKERCSIM